MGQTDQGVRRLQKEYQNLLKNPVKQILAQPDEKNIFTWHFCLHDMDYPYQNGYFHGKLIFTTKYPFEPPKLVFITPNGRFKTNTPICLSFTNFHPETWNPSQNVENMMISLISFMYQNEHTTGGEQSTNSYKQKMAAESLQFNMNNPEFVSIFKQHFDELTINEQQIEKSKQLEKKFEDNYTLEKVLFFTVSFLVIFGAYLFKKFVIEK